MTRSSTALPNTPQKWVSHVWPSVGQECFGANAPTVVIKQLAYDSRANGLMRLLGQPREKCRALLHGYPQAIVKMTCHNFRLAITACDLRLVTSAEWWDVNPHTPLMDLSGWTPWRPLVWIIIQHNPKVIDGGLVVTLG